MKSIIFGRIFCDKDKALSVWSHKQNNLQYLGRRRQNIFGCRFLELLSLYQCFLGDSSDFCKNTTCFNYKMHIADRSFCCLTVLIW